MGSDLGIGARVLMNKRGYLLFRKLKWKTDTEAVCTHSADTLFCWNLEDNELTADLTHDRPLILSQKYVMVIHSR